MYIRLWVLDSDRVKGKQLPLPLPKDQCGKSWKVMSKLYKIMRHTGGMRMLGVGFQPQLSWNIHSELELVE